MSRFLKILLIIIGVFLIVTLIGYFAIKSFLTPENIRTIAKRVMSEAIKHPLEMGKIGLSIGFKIGITVEDISLPNIEGFTPGPMIEIDKTTMNLKLLPLIQRKIVIGGIELSRPKIKLERNREGKLNIATILPKEMKGTGWTLSLSSLNISKGNIYYSDAVAKREMQIDDLNQEVKFNKSLITTTGRQSVQISKSKDLPEMTIKINNDIAYDTLKKNVDIKKLTAVYGPIHVGITGTIERNERLNLDGELKIDDMSKIIKLIPTRSRPEKLNGSLKTDISVLGTIKEPKIDGRCELKNISLAMKGMKRTIDKINGSLSFDQNAIRNIIIQGQIATTKFDVNGSVKNLNEPYLNIIVKIDGNLQDFEGLTNELEGIKMAGPMQFKISMRGMANDLSYSGDYRINGARIDGIGLAKPISNFYLKGSIQNDVARIDECTGHIGRSDFSLNGRVSNFKRPIAEINNRSNTIDLDELIPTPKEGQKKEGKPIPLTMKGGVQINKLTGMDMEFKNINTRFSFENGIIDVRDCAAETFDGKVTLDFYYDSNRPEPYRISTRMTTVSAQKILQRFLKFNRLEGKLSGLANFQGRGMSQKEVISNLYASGNLKFNQGVFNNFEFLTKLLAWLGMKDYKVVRFDDLMCNFNIDRGRAKINDWVLASSVGDFLVNGSVGLNGTLDLDITTTLPKQYASVVKKYHGDWLLYFDKQGRAIIDITVGGKLGDPKFSLNKAKIRNRLSGRIKEEFDKMKKELEDRFKNLFPGRR